MKKIMFNDKFGLTKAVLARTKTQTRRMEFSADELLDLGVAKGSCWVSGRYACLGEGRAHTLRFGSRELIAVAQNYKDIGMNERVFGNVPGWTNKMFVSAYLMPHQIKITSIRIERLQDISYEDILAEGIEHGIYYSDQVSPTLLYKVGKELYPDPKAAYAALIDKISGKGTWESNPWVVVYDFELVK